MAKVVDTVPVHTHTYTYILLFSSMIPGTEKPLVQDAFKEASKILLKRYNANHYRSLTVFRLETTSDFVVDESHPDPVTYFGWETWEEIIANELHLKNYFNLADFVFVSAIVPNIGVAADPAGYTFLGSRKTTLIEWNEDLSVLAVRIAHELGHANSNDTDFDSRLMNYYGSGRQLTRHEAEVFEN